MRWAAKEQPGAQTTSDGPELSLLLSRFEHWSMARSTSRPYSIFKSPAGLHSDEVADERLRMFEESSTRDVAEPMHCAALEVAGSWRVRSILS